MFLNFKKGERDNRETDQSSCLSIVLQFGNQNFKRQLPAYKLSTCNVVAFSCFFKFLLQMI